MTGPAVNPKDPASAGKIVTSLFVGPMTGSDMAGRI